MESDYLRYIMHMDHDVFDDLMKKYGQMVWNYAYVLTKNRSTTDDVSQEVFMQIYRNVASFRGESSVKTWILKITRNTSINHRNTAFIRRVVLMDKIISRKASISAEDAFIEQESSNHVWYAVFQLPLKLREVMMLDAKYEMKIVEIAHLLGVTEGTVKSRLHRARRKLSVLLKEDVANGHI